MLMAVAITAGLCRGQNAPAASAEKKTDPPIEEVSKQLMATFAEHWSAHGDSWLSHIQGETKGVPLVECVLEFKGVSTEVMPESLNEADELNGVTWKGSAAVRARVFRKYLFEDQRATSSQPAREKGWTDWEPLGRQDRIWLVKFEKRNGKWKQARIEQAGGFDPKVLHRVEGTDPEGKRPFDPSKILRVLDRRSDTPDAYLVQLVLPPMEMSGEIVWPEECASFRYGTSAGTAVRFLVDGHPAADLKTLRPGEAVRVVSADKNALAFSIRFVRQPLMASAGPPPLLPVPGQPVPKNSVAESQVVAYLKSLKEQPLVRVEPPALSTADQVAAALPLVERVASDAALSPASSCRINSYLADLYWAADKGAKAERVATTAFEKAIAAGIIPRRVVYVVSTGGSMIPLWAGARKQLTTKIEAMGVPQEFNVVQVAGGKAAALMGQTAVASSSDHKREASRILDNVFPGGVSTPSEGVVAAMLLKPDTIHIVSNGRTEESFTDVIQRCLDQKIRVNVTVINDPDGEKDPAIEKFRRLSTSTGGTFEMVKFQW